MCWILSSLYIHIRRGRGRMRIDIPCLDSCQQKGIKLISDLRHIQIKWGFRKFRRLNILTHINGQLICDLGSVQRHDREGQMCPPVCSVPENAKPWLKGENRGKTSETRGKFIVYLEKGLLEVLLPASSDRSLRCSGHEKLSVPSLWFLSSTSQNCFLLGHLSSATGDDI